MRSFFALNFQTFKRIQELDENVAQIHKKTLEIEMVANSVNSLARVSLPDQIGVLKRTQSDQFGLFEVLINSNSDEIIKAKKELKSVQNKTALDFKNDLENAINEIESNIALRESDRSHEFNKILNTTVSEVKLSQRQTKTDLTQFRVIKLFYKKFLLPLRSKKAGRFEKMLELDSSHSIVTRSSRVSRAPPHLPAFLSLNGILNHYIFNLRKALDDPKIARESPAASK